MIGPCGDYSAIAGRFAAIEQRREIARLEARADLGIWAVAPAPAPLARS
jgi:hypothetical protein